jgi:hypothetical protein
MVFYLPHNGDHPMSTLRTEEKSDVLVVHFNEARILDEVLIGQIERELTGLGKGMAIFDDETKAIAAYDKKGWFGKFG